MRSTYWLRRAVAGLGRRDCWPRKLVWPEPSVVPNALDPEALAQRHRELSDTLRYGMLGLIGFAFFCTLTVQTPDSELLTRGARVRIPFADTDVDFVTFVWVGPMLLVGYTVILHIFLGQLLALASVPERPNGPLRSSTWAGACRRSIRIWCSTGWRQSLCCSSP